MKKRLFIITALVFAIALGIASPMSDVPPGMSQIASDVPPGMSPGI